MSRKGENKTETRLTRRQKRKLTKADIIGIIGAIIGFARFVLDLIQG